MFGNTIQISLGRGAITCKLLASKGLMSRHTEYHTGTVFLLPGGPFCASIISLEPYAFENLPRTQGGGETLFSTLTYIAFSIAIVVARVQKALTVIKQKRRDFVHGARVQNRTVFVPRHCRASSAHIRQATSWLEPCFRQNYPKTQWSPSRSEAAAASI